MTMLIDGVDPTLADSLRQYWAGHPNATLDELCRHTLSLSTLVTDRTLKRSTGYSSSESARTKGTQFTKAGNTSRKIRTKEIYTMERGSTSGSSKWSSPNMSRTTSPSRSTGSTPRENPVLHCCVCLQLGDHDTVQYPHLSNNADGSAGREFVKKRDANYFANRERGCAQFRINQTDSTVGEGYEFGGT